MSLSETQREKGSQNQRKEANLWGFPPAGKSSLKQIIHSPCYPKHGCFKRMRAQQRSCLYGREKRSERRPWPYTGYPRDLSTEGKKKTAGGRKGENAEQVTYKRQLQTVKEKQNKAKQKTTCGWQWSMLTSHSFLSVRNQPVSHTPRVTQQRHLELLHLVVCEDSDSPKWGWLRCSSCAHSPSAPALKGP